MKPSVSHSLIRLCSRKAGPAVIAALVALLTVEVAIPPQLSGFDYEASCQEFEEEDGEPSESSGEQALPEFAVPLSNCPQRSESRFVQRIVEAIAQRARKSLTNLSTPAELAHRNGTGGPLRC